MAKEIFWSFYVQGISYENANVSQRERFYLSEIQIRLLIERLKEVCAIREVLVLCTCHRTEIYYTLPPQAPEETHHTVIRLLRHVSGNMSQEVPDKYFYHFSTEKAIQHLFEVSLGMRSQVHGDRQVISQVKQAYERSTEQKAVEPYLHRLMHSLFYTHKLINKHTLWREGAASIAYAAVKLLEALLKDAKKPKILLLGLGKAGRDVLGYLSENTLKFDVTLANRTLQKALDFAKIHNYKVIKWEEIQKNMPPFHAIITCINGYAPFITKEMLSKTQKDPTYIIDLSVPRTVKENVTEHPGTLLYNIDEMKEKTSKAQKQRLKALPKMREIIEEQIEAFAQWTKEMQYLPMLHKLKNALEEMRKAEVAQHIKHLSEKEKDAVEKITKSFIQRIVKEPAIHIKSVCKRNETNHLAKALVYLFDIEQQEKLNKSAE